MAANPFSSKAPKFSRQVNSATNGTDAFTKPAKFPKPPVTKQPKFTPPKAASFRRGASRGQ